MKKQVQVVDLLQTLACETTKTRFAFHFLNRGLGHSDCKNVLQDFGLCRVSQAVLQGQICLVSFEDFDSSFELPSLANLPFRTDGLPVLLDHMHASVLVSAGARMPWCELQKRADWVLRIVERRSVRGRYFSTFLL